MNLTRKLALALLVAVSGAPGRQDAEERRRAVEIQAKQRRGETLTAEERRFAQEYIARQRAEYAKTHPPRESTGMIPLTDLGRGVYKGEEGGLYPGGSNAPPRAHQEMGMQLARQIVPLDEDGRPSAEGRIVLLSTGMSNATQEFQVFQKLAQRDPDLNPQVAIVDGAQGGQTAAITARLEANYWKVVAERLSVAGVTSRQVQVTWIKQANARPSAPFPGEVRKLQQDLAQTLRNLREKFPNLKIAYLSSRIYGGYAAGPLNPEPHAYETGFAVKWLIAGQIAGNPELNCDPNKGAVRAPWIAWGPYLWADGLKGRSDGLIYRREDFAEDGTHPSPSGREKVAKLLLQFFKTEPTARPWFLKR